MNIDKLDQLLDLKLRSLYSVEQQIINNLPGISARVTNKILKDSLDKHFDETRMQATRLENIALNRHITLDGVTDLGIEGIFQQGKTVLDMISENDVMDTAIVGEAQKVESYEMASYASLISLAKKLNEDDIVDQMKKTYDEEKNASNKLASMSEEGIFSKIADAIS